MNQKNFCYAIHLSLLFPNHKVIQYSLCESSDLRELAKEDLAFATFDALGFSRLFGSVNKLADKAIADLNAIVHGKQEIVVSETSSYFVLSTDKEINFEEQLLEINQKDVMVYYDNDTFVLFISKEQKNLYHFLKDIFQKENFFVYAYPDYETYENQLWFIKK
ncbi:MAG: hypothetical protein ACLU8F_01185 [Clostridia bacterium]